MSGSHHKIVETTRAQAGFSLVELLVVMIVTILLTGLILTFFIDYWGGTATLSNDSQTFVERENAGDRLRDALNVAAHLIEQNSIADTHATVPDPTDVSGTHWLLIHAVPENIPMPSSGSYTPVFYYEAPSVNSTKQFIMNGSQPYYDEFVLYLSGTTKQLLLRSLANPSATGDIVTTSCPPAQATNTCFADADVSDDVQSVDVNYFSKSGNVINYTSITDPNTGQYIGPDFPVVEVVQLTVHLSRTSVINGAASSLDETIVRVALRN